MNGVPEDVRQPESSSLMLVSEPLVIHSELPQEGGMEVVNRNRMSRDVIAKIIRLPERHPRSNPAPCHPNRKTAGMMIATVRIRTASS